MRVLTFALLATLSVSACASAADQQMPPIDPGRFASYQAYLESYIHDHLDAGTPEPVRAAYAKCVSTFTVAQVSDSDRSRLDAYARGEAQMTQAEMAALDKKLAGRAGHHMTKEKLTELSPYCPDSISDFRRYMFK